MMKKNIHFNILLLLLLVEAMTVHAFAQSSSANHNGIFLSKNI